MFITPPLNINYFNFSTLFLTVKLFNFYQYKVIFKFIIFSFNNPEINTVLLILMTTSYMGTD